MADEIKLAEMQGQLQTLKEAIAKLQKQVDENEEMQNMDRKCAEARLTNLEETHEDRRRY